MAHALRARADPSIDPTTVAERLNVDKTRYQEVLSNQNTDPRVVGGGDLGSMGKRLAMTVRFEESEPIDEIVQLIYQGTLHDSEWVVVNTHTCQHDASTGACDGWQRAADRGAVPEGM